MSANGGSSKGEVMSIIKNIEESINHASSQSSPIYGGGHRTMAPTGRSSAGSDKESGFMGTPNSQKGKADRR